MIYVLTVFLLCIYLGISCFFYLYLKNSTYVGIRVNKIQNEWQVKRIEPDGIANNYDVLKGDVVKRVNGDVANSNNSLKKWLIVDNVHSITLERNNKKKEIIFSKNSTLIMRKYIAFFSIGILGFLFLFHFIKKQNVGRSSWYFYSLLILIVFSLSAVVPSSLGESLGRIMIVLFISLFPFYIESFLCTTRYDMNNKKSKLIKIILLIALFNLLLSALMVFIGLPYIFAEYLAQGIFFVFMILLLLVLYKNLFLRRNNNKNDSKVDLCIISILSFSPLLLCYIFPIKWKVPFYLVIPFTVLPVLAILHSLILSKLISYRLRISNKSVYCIITILLSCIIGMDLLISKYIPNFILIIYTFLLIYSLLPYIEETLLTMRKHSVHTNSISLFSAVENERENISMYIHDSIIQDVIYSIRKIDSSSELVPKKEVIYVLKEVVFYLRELCSDIYPLMIQEIGLKNTLIGILNELQRKHPVTIHLDIKIDEMKFVPQKNNFILRSIRELVNNSILHGNATDITVSIFGRKDTCCILVKDNGDFKTKKDNYKSHFGLNIIEEKLKLLNGELTISFDNCTMITMKLPFDRKGENENENENCLN